MLLMRARQSSRRGDQITAAQGRMRLFRARIHPFCAGSPGSDNEPVDRRFVPQAVARTPVSGDIGSLLWKAAAAVRSEILTKRLQPRILGSTA